jgi:excisionase family DNA binding protein
MEKQYLTATEAAGIYGVKAKTLYEWARLRKVPSHKINGCRRFHKEQLDRFFQSKSIAPKKIVA